jgi:hypothetical protein
MIGSIITAKVGKGFVGGYELDLLLLSIAVPSTNRSRKIFYRKPKGKDMVAATKSEQQHHYK